MAKVTVTLTGAFSNRDAAIDGVPLMLVGFGDQQKATVTVERGDHELTWVVTGAPDLSYKVALAGDTADWSADFTAPHGRDIGLQPFKVGHAASEPAGGLQVTVTFKGSFAILDVFIDDGPILAVASGSARGAKMMLPRGKHTLKWFATGALDATYEVVIGGAASWSDRFVMSFGRSVGVSDFEVQ